MADELEKLELLSLVNSITQELVNHTGLSGTSRSPPRPHRLLPSLLALTSSRSPMPDSTLAEFLIHLHGESKDFKTFKQKCSDVGAEFPDSFLQAVDRLILSMHPKYKVKKAATAAAKGKGKADGAAPAEAVSEDKQKQMRLFPGLALPDSDWIPSFTPDDPATVKERQMRMGQPVDVKGASDNNRQRDEDQLGVDDLMAQLEGVRKRTVDDDPRDAKRTRHRSPDYERRDDDRRGGRDDGRGRDDGYGGGRDNGYGDRGRPGAGSGGGSRYGEDDRGRYGRDGRTGGAGPARLDEKPVLYKIYPGKVANVKDFGAFVTLEGIMGRIEGMVHIGQISSARVTHPSDLISRGQSVFVKVMSITGTRLSLSMKDADQRTGADLSPHLRVKTEEELLEESRKAAERAATGPNGVAVRKSFADDHRTASVRRLTSPERWEIKQLIASGAASASDYPGLDDDLLTPSDFSGGKKSLADEADEELDIEINEADAPFLSGQSKRALELSPVKIVKAPDGGLNRAAMAGAALAKERRELKAQEAQDEAGDDARNVNTPWLDPMAQQHERSFAADARGAAAGQRAKDMPAWKKATFNQATTFGKITSLSIGDQRKSLPIFKFRDQLIEAFANVRPFSLMSCSCVLVNEVLTPPSALLACRTRSSSSSATPGRARRPR